MSTMVKFCGLTTPIDVEAANLTRPDLVGFVFAPSRRQLSLATARELRRGLDAGIPVVGVFVDQDPGFIARLVHEGVIDHVQLHGDEDESYLRALRSLLGLPEPSPASAVGPLSLPANPTPLGAAASAAETTPALIKARSLSAAGPAFPAGADYALFDAAPAPGEARGGNGRTFAWGLLVTAAQPFFLAGGLTAQNVGAAIRAAQPFGVDVSSGVETGQKKDLAKMRAFLHAVRAIDQEMENER